MSDALMTRIRRLVVAATVTPLLCAPLVAGAVCDSDGQADAPAARRASNRGDPHAAAAQAPGERAAADPGGAAETGGDEASAPPAAAWKRHLSPLTPDVVARVRAIAGQADRKDDVFAKVGDSATVNRAFLQCFSDPDMVDLGAHDELADTVKFFREGQAAYRDPYRRKSKAAKVGWSTWHVLSGHPSPLLQEVRAIGPRYAVVMLGENELDDEGLKHYPARMLRIVDSLSARGVIPILYTLLPRNDDPESDALVPLYNAVIEAIARQRKLPWIDFYSAIKGLPNRGLASDDVHPSAPVRDGHVVGCDLSSAGLRFGQNVRNLLTMMMLERLRGVLDGGDAPASGSASQLQGSGTSGSPYVIDGLPFAVLGSTEGGQSSIDSYPGCDADSDESGPERVYRLDVGSQPVEARVLYSSDVDVDVHVLGDSVDGDSCIARDDERAYVELGSGTEHVVVDTFAGRGPHPGEYVLLVRRAEPPERD